MLLKCRQLFAILKITPVQEEPLVLGRCNGMVYPLRASTFSSCTINHACIDWCLLHQVVVLRSLRSKLSEALAELHSTTSALHLRAAKHEDADNHAGRSSGAGDGNHTEHLFPQARQAIVQTCNSCSKVFVMCPRSNHNGVK